MNIKVSIVVPVYNVGKYLKRCINSLINQSYSNLEIILVDDGSKDDSGAICDEYSLLDARIEVIHQENKGLSGARNSGIDIATGEYIAFIDSDDYVSEYLIEKLLGLVTINNCDIAICRFIRFGNELILDKNNIENNQIYSAQEALLNLHGKDGQVYTVAWNKLYRKSLFNKLRYPLRKINEDEFLTYILFDRSNKIILTDEVLYYYFQNDNSITTNPEYLKNEDIFLALEEREVYFKEKNNSIIVEVVQKAYLDRIISRYRMLLSDKINNNSYTEKLLKRYKNYYKKSPKKRLGIGYFIFNFSPGLYFDIYRIKNIVTG